MANSKSQKSEDNVNNKNIVAKGGKRKRTTAGSKVAIITLSILLGLSLVLGITAAYFTTTQSATGNITLGNPVTIGITQGGASVSSLTFNGSALPGTVYDQTIGVAAPANVSQAVLRAKLSITNTDSASVNVNATTTTSWTAGEDDYYYYNGTITAGNTVDFCTAITIPTTLVNADANKTYAIAVQVEAIQFANGAASEVWTTAPTTWITNYGSGTTPS